ncbi:hypothetical protein CPX_001792 [Candidatus Phytoplasma pruni]|uniref:Uncharacterized protein n=1 Tax=Candidatus Phytoplasma pruni TaxID=479893 RepID=A0A0M1MZB4_9MOLU|nr:hypothetical protein [Poinsettia branch-inducing phytoplasma]KOR75247.1 hypothetical protein CPX_001792 [Candidatus Phytoplasma pruni]WEK82518.1 MAG: hypothetical protein PR2021_4520 [Candidatus Phytoplasma pruni]
MVNEIWNNILNNWVAYLIVSLIILAGPLQKLIKLLMRFVLFLLNFFFGEEKEKNDINNKNPQISIQNQLSDDVYKNKNLSLIELTILDMKRKEEAKNSREKDKDIDLIRLELYQSKLESKMELNQQQNFFEKELLKQKLELLEKELLKNSIKNSFNFNGNEKNQRKNDNSNNNNSNDNNGNNSPERENVNEKPIDLSFIEETINKQIPKSLKKIFDQLKNVSEMQLFMLNNMPMNDNSFSYYDDQKNALYIDPKDLPFVKALLVDKTNKQLKN